MCLQRKKYATQLESMLITHVFPEFTSPLGYMRARVSSLTTGKCLHVRVYTEGRLSGFDTQGFMGGGSPLEFENIFREINSEAFFSLRKERPQFRASLMHKESSSSSPPPKPKILYETYCAWAIKTPPPKKILNPPWRGRVGGSWGSQDPPFATRLFQQS